jgi:subtilisin-like proprotein convertase family protein
MRLIFTKLAFALIIFFSALHLKAQNNFFTDAPETFFKGDKKVRVIIPSKYRTLQLDSVSLLAFLKVLPSGDNGSDHSNMPILEIPMPGGNTAKFRVWQSAAMEPALAAAFPYIRTFTGQGIDDPTAVIKMDFTEFGFHAMILSPVTGSVFIDPYSSQNNVEYISYFKSDYRKEGVFKELPPVKKNTGANVRAASPNGVLAGQCIGTQLRSYRLALACTGEYARAVTGSTNPTKAAVLAKMVTTMNRVNGVYETDLAIHMNIIANDTAVIYTNPSTDPFTGNNDGEILIDESQAVIDFKINNANYDIGHTFSTGGGGIAQLGAVCISGAKASGITGSAVPSGDAYDIDFVAHEMGHQFGADHAFNSADLCGSTAGDQNAEPGSGTTIMCYAGVCADDNIALHSDAQFHPVSYNVITTYSINSTGNSCAVKSASGNVAPVVNAGADYVIPKSTPFILSGTATDANDAAGAITYCWDQIDVGGPNGVSTAPAGNAPLFRSFTPKTTGLRYFPQLSDVINNTTTLGELLPTYARTMRFRLTARDNHAGCGGVCFDENAVTVNEVAGPFVVTYPNTSGINLTANDFKTITWNPAGTAAAPISCANVSIQLSTDGGQTFPITILASTPNDGTQEILVPNNITNTARIRILAVGNVFYDMSNSNFAIKAPTSPGFSFNTPASVSVCGASSGTATVLSAAQLGFATPINLSASLLPVGTTVSFGTNTLTPGNSTTVTLNNTNTLAAGGYTIRVTGVAGSITKTTDITFIVGTSSPAPTSLSLPANDAIGIEPLPNFNWSAVTGAINYGLEISTAANFQPITQTIDNITSLPFTLSTPLAENTVYYWRVKSTNTCGTGTASNTPNRFKTGYSSCSYSVDVPINISEQGTPTITSTITIPSGQNFVISDVNIVGLNGVHSFVQNLSFTLTSPNNTTVTLLNGICDGGWQDFDLSLDDQSANTVSCPPTGGQVVQPATPLAAFNGQNSAGTWTLSITDNEPGNGGSLNGWGINFNSSSIACSTIPTPLALTYTFTGNGNWNIPANWSNGVVPPSPLPAGASIVINHAVGGQCLLNVTQTIAAGASLTIVTGKNLIIPGILTIQ